MDIPVLGTVKISVLYASIHRAISSPEPIATLLSRALEAKEAIKGCYVPSTPNLFEGEFIPIALQSHQIGDIVEYRGMHYLIGSETMEYLPDFARIQAWQELWEVVKDTLHLNIHGDDLQLARSQKKLNLAYDGFVDIYGIPQDKSNKALFRKQSGYGVICSLLIDGEKSAIFHRRTVAKSVEYVVETAEQGYLASLNQFGKVDIKWIAKKLHVSLEDAIAQLKGFAYYDGAYPPQDPADTDITEWRDRNDYISGNVRKRLEKVQFWTDIPEWLNIEVYLDTLRHNQSLPCVPLNSAIKRDVIEALNLEAYLPEDEQRDMFNNEITLLMGAYIGKHTSSIYQAFARFLFHDDYQYFEKELQDAIKAKTSVSYAARKYALAISVDYFNKNQKHEFDVVFADNVKTSGKNTKEWAGGHWRSGREIFEICLGDRNPIVYDTVTMWVDGKEVKRQVENKEGTAACTAAKKNMLKAWDEWLWSDPDRAILLTDWYNSEINVYKVPTLDGSYLTFPQAAEIFQGKPLTFHDHQLDLVELVIRNHGKGTGAYHCVGAGKTLEAAMIAMKLRELIANHKTLIVVLGSTTTQFADQCRGVFPQATLLVRSPDTNVDLRREFLSRLAFESYDIAICTKEDFEAIPYSSEVEQYHLKAELSKMEKSNSKKAQKQRVQKKDAIVKHLNYLKSGKDDSLYWKDLGIDCVIFDEAHCLLNIPIKSTLRNVAGIPSGDGSKQAGDALLKFHDLYRRNKRVVLLTGTHLVNTIAQMYSNQMLLQPDLLRELGLDSFDAWRAMFGKIVSSLEISATGRLKKKERFSNFNNIPELKNMCAQSMDIKTKQDLKLRRPNIRHIVLSSEPHASQIAYMNSLVARALAVKNREVDPKEDNMLVITTDGILGCMHMALVDPNARDWVNHKLNACAWNVWKIWQATRDVKATQLVFSDVSTPKKQQKPYKVVVESNRSIIVAQGSSKKDNGIRIGYLIKDVSTGYWYNKSLDGTYESILFKSRHEACEDLIWELAMIPENYGSTEFTAYQYIKQVCCALGMPEDQFVFIHDYEKDKRDTLFKDVNDGAIAVVMGSTEKLGTGVNVQKRLIAIHKIDVPWTPAKDDQRIGRIERPGSMFEDYIVYDFQYLTQGSQGSASIDGFKAQALQAKADGFRQFSNLNSKNRKCGDIDVEPMTYAQMKAIASSDPRIMEKFKAEGELVMLLAEERAWQMNRRSLEKEEFNLPQERIDLIDRIALIKDATAYVEPYLVKPAEEPVLTPASDAEKEVTKKKSRVKKEKPPTLPIDRIIGLDGIAYEGDSREEYLVDSMNDYAESSQKKGRFSEPQRKVATYCGCDIYMYIPKVGMSGYHANGFLLFPNGLKVSISNTCYFREIKKSFSQTGSNLIKEENRLISIESKMLSVGKELNKQFVDEDGNNCFDRIAHLRVLIDELETIFQQEASEQQFAIGDEEEFEFAMKSQPSLMPDRENPAIIRELREKDYLFWFRPEDNYPNWLVEIKSTAEAINAPRSNVLDFPDIKKDYGVQGKSDLRLTTDVEIDMISLR